MQKDLLGSPTNNNEEPVHFFNKLVYNESRSWLAHKGFPFTSFIFLFLDNVIKFLIQFQNGQPYKLADKTIFIG